MNNLYYVLTVAIWGSTWFAIRLQLNVVPTQVSIAYRFGLATLILFGWCLLRQVRLRYSWADHRLLALLGLTLFSTNYALLYEAERHVISGEVAIAFSLLGVFNILNNRLFFGITANRQVVLGSLLGFLGIVLTFWRDLMSINAGSQNLLGILLTLGGTYSASLGNMVWSRLQKRGLRVLPANGFGMLYGTLALVLYCLLCRVRFTFDPSPAYIGSLLYLALFGSVIAFALYLTLVGNIGADRAGYVSILFPIVALLFSIALEGYQMNLLSFLGIACILVGNAVVMARNRRPQRRANARLGFDTTKNTVRK
jgi:drug/metabolite transporter (DMT)-like permease